MNSFLLCFHYKCVVFLEQAKSIHKILVECGFSQKEKRQSEMFVGSKYENTYNQIWCKVKKLIFI